MYDVSVKDEKDEGKEQIEVKWSLASLQCLPHRSALAESPLVQFSIGVTQRSTNTYVR